MHPRRFPRGFPGHPEGEHCQLRTSATTHPCECLLQVNGYASTFRPFPGKLRLCLWSPWGQIGRPDTPVFAFQRRRIRHHGIAEVMTAVRGNIPDHCVVANISNGARKEEPDRLLQQSICGKQPLGNTITRSWQGNGANGYRSRSQGIGDVVRERLRRGSRASSMQ